MDASAFTNANVTLKPMRMLSSKICDVQSDRPVCSTPFGVVSPVHIPRVTLLGFTQASPGAIHIESRSGFIAK
jgi:hypothetical protein